MCLANLACSCCDWKIDHQFHAYKALCLILTVDQLTCYRGFHAVCVTMWCYGNMYQNAQFQLPFVHSFQVARGKLVGIPFACIVKQCQTSGKEAQEMRSPQPSYVVGVHDPRTGLPDLVNTLCIHLRQYNMRDLVLQRLGRSHASFKSNMFDISVSQADRHSMLHVPSILQAARDMRSPQPSYVVGVHDPPTGLSDLVNTLCIHLRQYNMRDLVLQRLGRSHASFKSNMFDISVSQASVSHVPSILQAARDMRSPQPSYVVGVHDPPTGLSDLVNTLCIHLRQYNMRDLVLQRLGRSHASFKSNMFDISVSQASVSHVPSILQAARDRRSPQPSYVVGVHDPPTGLADLVNTLCTHLRQYNMRDLVLQRLGLSCWHPSHSIFGPGMLQYA